MSVGGGDSSVTRSYLCARRTVLHCTVCTVLYCAARGALSVIFLAFLIEPHATHYTAQTVPYSTSGK
jgi:hypothetical protein